MQITSAFSIEKMYNITTIVWMRMKKKMQPKVIREMNDVYEYRSCLCSHFYFHIIFYIFSSLLNNIITMSSPFSFQSHYHIKLNRVPISSSELFELDSVN